MRKMLVEWPKLTCVPPHLHNRGVSILAALLATSCVPFAHGKEIDNTSVVNPVNLVTNVGGSASSDTKCLNNNSSFGVAKAFDTIYFSDNTRWIGHGSTLPQRAVWTFPDPTIVDTVRIYNANSSGADQSPSDFTIAGSNDGSDWTTLDTESGVTGWTANKFRTFQFVNRTPYLKYRLEVTDVQGHTRMTITEIELYRLVPASFSVSAQMPTFGTDSFSTDWTLVCDTTADASLVYDTDESFATATTNSLGTGLAADTRTATLTGLEPDTTYWWKIVANDGSETAETIAASFTTKGAPVLGTATATADGETASFSVALATAAMENTLATSVSVFYGTDGETWTELPLGSASEAQTFSGTVQSLGYGVACQWYAKATATLAGGRVLSAQTDVASFTTLYNGDMYVDAAAQNATAPYSTPATAAPDIATALALATDGATIHVAPGTYKVSSPVSVAAAVAVIGDSPSAVVVTNTVSAGYTHGGNHRVFELRNAGAVVAGLTIAGGSGWGTSGCGFWISTDGGTVSNCVVSGGRTKGNQANAAGGYLEGGCVTHTVFRDNLMDIDSDKNFSYRPGVLWMQNASKAENCLFTENNQTKAVTLINLGGSSVMRNCTIVDSGLSVTNEYCKEWSALNISSGATVQNVVIAGVTNTVDGSAVLPTGTVAKFANGAVDGDIADLGFPEGTVVGTAASFFKDYANGDYTPKTRGPLVNKGANYEGMASVDLAGKKRLNGSKIDIGCYETSSSALMIVLR